MESLEPRLLLSADLSGVGVGLQALLTQLDPAIVREVERSPLPLIGSQVAALGNPVAASLGNVATAIGAATSSIGASSSPTDLQAALFSALGPNGANLLLNNQLDSDNGTPRLQDIQVSGTPDAPRFSMELGGHINSFAMATDSRLGLPSGLGLTLNASGTVQASENYALLLDFGVDASGFFVNPDPFGAGKPAATVHVDLATPNLNLAAKLGLWQAAVQDVAANPTKLSGDFVVFLRDPNADGHFHPGSETPSFDAQLSGQSLVDLNTTLSLNNDPRYPKFGAQLQVAWPLGFPSDATHPETFGSTPTVSFQNVTLTLGSFLGDSLSNTLSPIADVIKPAQPLLDILTARLPVVSDLAGRKMTLLDLFGGPDSSGLDIASQVSSALTLVNQVSGLGTSITLRLGNFSFASDDIRSSDFSLATATPTILGTKVNLPGELFGFTAFPNLPSLVDGKSELQLPFLTDPLKAFGVLLGQSEDLITFDPPAASFSMNPTPLEFPLVGPLVAKLSAGLSFSLNLGFGYDTEGLYALAQGGPATDLANGVFISSPSSDGAVMTLTGFAQAGAAIDLGLIDAGVAGGVKASVKFSLNGANGDGKERLAGLLGGPLSALTADGSLEAYLRLFIDIGIGPFSVPFDIDVPLATLLDFSGGGVQPVLAQMDPSLGDGVLRLNVGAFASARNFRPNTVDESFAVRHVGGAAGDESVMVIAFGKAEEFDHVKKVYADAGDGDNTLSATGYVANKDGTFSLVPTQWLEPNPDGFGGLNLTNDPPTGPIQFPPLTAVESPVEFHSGGGKDLLVGGAGFSLLDAGAGRDVLIGGVGPNRMLGGDDNEQYDESRRLQGKMPEWPRSNSEPAVN